MNLAGKKIVVVGLGRTGMATAQFLNKRRVSVVATDMAGEEELGSQVESLRKIGVRVELGEHRPAIFDEADMIVISPGVPHEIEPVRMAANRGIPVIGEIELASRFIREPIVAVTGTNGKTTTIELLGEMLKKSGRNIFMGGNIGNPLIGYADLVGDAVSDEKAEIVVAEISSFQLDTINTFKPHVGVLLNITPDHLDRYENFDAYAGSKLRLFENQGPADFSILNSGDPLVMSLTQNIKTNKLYFTNPAENAAGATLNGSRIIINPGSCLPVTTDSLYLDITKLKLVGRHNLENVCAASLAALAAGGTIEGVQNALDSFRGLPHRLEFIRSIKEVDFYNDSKATNVDAVDRALQCFSNPVILIMGGLDKGGVFEKLHDAVRRHAKQIILLGAAAPKIASVLGQEIATETVESMQAAVKCALSQAAPGDVVLLSPGCASFDMYTSYADRGDDFRREVEKLEI